MRPARDRRGAIGVMGGMVETNAILRIAEQVRREMCDRNPAAPCSSAGVCEFLSRVLEERLHDAGLTAQRVGGYYTAATDVEPASESPTTTNWDGIWLHWWIECEGFVIDVAADRFHPTEPGTAAVVMLPKAAALAYHERLPGLEPRSAHRCAA